ncbi:MAG TPA: peptidoglycan DD-metalloendopeptidase family protein [Kofleriaceae bacterium]|nr:peptidoglycan DD-metalloendopeptidase family protein [Kofleriaceae bacterium]
MKSPGVAGSAAPPSPEDVRAHQVQTAAKQLEAFFLRQLLAEARRASGGAIDGGFAGDTFKQMLDEAVADKASAAGGVGMAAMFAKQLGAAAGAGHVAHPPPAPGTSAIATSVAATAPHAPAVGSAAAPGAPQFLVPVSGRPSSGYGLRTDPIHGGTVNHPGFDLAAATGTEVAAAARGTVVHAGPAGTYGNLVTLRHDNGFETRYAHLSEVDVKVGDVVEAGAELGKVGTTGYSTGPHLHFEVRHDGQAIDPAPLLPLNRSATRTTR